MNEQEHFFTRADVMKFAAAAERIRQSLDDLNKKLDETNAEIRKGNHESAKGRRKYAPGGVISRVAVDKQAR